jgi:hypothetical protein
MHTLSYSWLKSAIFGTGTGIQYGRNRASLLLSYRYPSSISKSDVDACIFVFAYRAPQAIASDRLLFSFLP